MDEKERQDKEMLDLFNPCSTSCDYYWVDMSIPKCEKNYNCPLLIEYQAKCSILKDVVGWLTDVADTAKNISLVAERQDKEIWKDLASKSYIIGGIRDELEQLLKEKGICE